MLLDEYQKMCEKYALPSSNSLLYLIPGLAAEAGEVAGHWAKYIRAGAERDFDPPKDKILKELGDVLWFVARIGALYGVSMSDIARMNIEKLEDRQKRGVLVGFGDER